MRNRICYKLGFSKKCKENTDYLKLNVLTVLTVLTVLIKSCMNGVNGQLRKIQKEHIFRTS